MNQPDIHRLDKKRIRESFNAAADTYDDVAVLQQEVGKRILERLEFIKTIPTVVLDVGSGTGQLSRALSQRYCKSQVISLDLAPRMLENARRQNNWFTNRFGKQAYVCGDAEQLPVADHSVDLIFSSLALQWCTELERVFAEFRRILKPEGLLMFSTFGPDTLKELRHSWHVADENPGANVHVNDFIDMHDIGDALLRAGLTDPVMDAENFTLTYPDAYQLMRELKTIGAHNAANQRRQTLTGKTRLKNMIEAYETFRTNGSLPATYEVVYGHAWGPKDLSEIQVPLSSLNKTGI